MRLPPCEAARRALVTSCVLFAVSHASALDPPDSLLVPPDSACAAADDLLRWECYLPGALADPYLNGCHHPIRRFRRNCSCDDSAAAPGDSLVQSLRIALYTYSRFSAILPPVRRHYSPSHAALLRYLDIAPEPPRVNWWELAMVRLGELFDRLATWLAERLGPSVKAFGPAWPAILIGGFSVIVFFVLVVVGRLVSRYFPTGSEATVIAGNAAIRAPGADVLSRAAESLSDGDPRGCIVFLYRWLVETASRRLVKREEWWTNGQLLALLASRSPVNRQLCLSIVRLYESAVFGHHTVTSRELGDLLTQARSAVLR